MPHFNYISQMRDNCIGEPCGPIDCRKVTCGDVILPKTLAVEFFGTVSDPGAPTIPDGANCGENVGNVYEPNIFDIILGQPIEVTQNLDFDGSGCCWCLPPAPAYEVFAAGVCDDYYTVSGGDLCTASSAGCGGVPCDANTIGGGVCGVLPMGGVALGNGALSGAAYSCTYIYPGVGTQTRILTVSGDNYGLLETLTVCFSAGVLGVDVEVHVQWQLGERFVFAASQTDTDGTHTTDNTCRWYFVVLDYTFTRSFPAGSAWADIKGQDIPMTAGSPSLTFTWLCAGARCDQTYSCCGGTSPTPFCDTLVGLTGLSGVRAAISDFVCRLLDP